MGFKAASDREAVSRGAFFLDEKDGRTWSPLIGVGKDCRQSVLEIQNDSALFTHEWPDQPELWERAEPLSFKTSGFVDVSRHDRPVLTLPYTSCHAD